MEYGTLVHINKNNDLSITYSKSPPVSVLVYEPFDTIKTEMNDISTERVPVGSVACILIDERKKKFFYRFGESDNYPFHQVQRWGQLAISSQWPEDWEIRLLPYDYADTFMQLYLGEIDTHPQTPQNVKVYKSDLNYKTEWKGHLKKNIYDSVTLVSHKNCEGKIVHYATDGADHLFYGPDLCKDLNTDYSLNLPFETDITWGMILDEQSRQMKYWYYPEEAEEFGTIIYPPSCFSHIWPEWEVEGFAGGYKKHLQLLNIPDKGFLADLQTIEAWFSSLCEINGFDCYWLPNNLY